MPRDDHIPGYIYLVHSAEKSKTIGEAVFKFGLSRHVPTRIRHLNKASYIKKNGGREGAYAGVQDWRLAAMWRTDDMQSSESELKHILLKQGIKLNEERVFSLTKVNDFEFHDLLNRYSEDHELVLLANYWRDRIALIEEIRAKSSTAWIADDQENIFDFPPTEHPEYKYLNVAELLTEDTIEETYRAHEDGWPYDDDT